MKRKLAMVLCLALVVFGLSVLAESNPGGRYDALIALLEAGSVDAARQEFDRIANEIERTQAPAEVALTPIGLDDVIRMDSFSLQFKEIKLFRAGEYPEFHYGDSGWSAGDVPEGATSLFILYGIDGVGESFDMYRHCRAELAMPDRTYDLQVDNLFGTDVAFWADLPPAVAENCGAGVLNLYLKDDYSFGDEWYDALCDAAYAVRLSADAAPEMSEPAPAPENTGDDAQVPEAALENAEPETAIEAASPYVEARLGEALEGAGISITLDSADIADRAELRKVHSTPYILEPRQENASVVYAAGTIDSAESEGYKMRNHLYCEFVVDGKSFPAELTTALDTAYAMGYDDKPSNPQACWIHATVHNDLIQACESLRLCVGFRESYSYDDSVSGMNLDTSDVVYEIDLKGGHAE